MIGESRGISKSIWTSETVSLFCQIRANFLADIHVCSYVLRLSAGGDHFSAWCLPNITCVNPLLQSHDLRESFPLNFGIVDFFLNRFEVCVSKRQSCSKNQIQF